MSDQNPYEPPRSEVRDSPSVVEQRFRWKAVALGTAADIVGSVVGGAVLFALVFTRNDGQDAAGLMKSLAMDPGYLLMSLLVGLLFSVLGGYVAGRVADHTQLKHALVTGVCSMALGTLIGGDSSAGPYEGIMNLLGYGLHFPAVLAGGWVAKRAAQI
jgi:hypothetical protein